MLPCFNYTQAKTIFPISIFSQHKKAEFTLRRKDMNTCTSKLNMTNRMTRILIGSSMVGITMAASGSLGYLTLLPLLAIYPLMTGLLGEDPVNGLFARWQGGYNGHSLKPFARTVLLAVAAVAIGVVMTSPEGAVSVAGIITLFSVFPVMAGLFGEDLVTALFNGEGRVTLRTTEMIEDEPGTVHHHEFVRSHSPHDKAA